MPEDLERHELDRRILVVSTCFAEACGALPPDSEPAKFLALARTALGIPRSQPLKPELALAKAAVWRMAQAFQTLRAKRMDFSQHLQMMLKGGMPNYGVPDDSGQHTFKDFELELHVAGLLLEWSEASIELHPPGHPFDLSFGPLRVDFKHPSSANGIAKSISRFGQKLSEQELKGVIVFGVEDVLELAHLPILESPEAIGPYLEARCIESFSGHMHRWEEAFQRWSGILGVYFMATAPVYFREGERVDFILCPLRHPLGLRRTGHPDSDAATDRFLFAISD